MGAGIAHRKKNTNGSVQNKDHLGPSWRSKTLFHVPLSVGVVLRRTEVVDKLFQTPPRLRRLVEATLLAVRFPEPQPH